MGWDLVRLTSCIQTHKKLTLQLQSNFGFLKGSMIDLSFSTRFWIFTRLQGPSQSFSESKAWTYTARSLSYDLFLHYQIHQQSAQQNRCLTVPSFWTVTAIPPFSFFPWMWLAMTDSMKWMQDKGMTQTVTMNKKQASTPKSATVFHSMNSIYPTSLPNVFPSYPASEYYPHRCSWDGDISWPWTWWGIGGT